MAAKEEKNSVQWALDLLEPTPLDLSHNILKYYFVPYIGSICAVSVMTSNMLMKKPIFANKSYILFGTLSGTLASYILYWISDVYYSRRDAVMRDYIMLHPERFPEPSNRKYADVFKEWFPRR